ncbi:hypothetical protein ABFS82_06G157500 [Erythranthe guttata]|nr:PREDICTED: probable E3 ubiquitin-protein ligase ARI7 [Erythranthe guttata]|eukprot:XP_012836666.1 PREDICTED: probable E3 ubiquitin-protein ligase ARI7 [Erythranthe guttata]
MNWKNYTILNEKGIRHLQNNDISKVSTHLSVSKGVACTLLLRNNWSTNSVFDEWFSDEEKVRESVGLLPEQPPPDNNLCKICFERIEVENMLSGPCGHPFCTNCWKSYVAVSINDGPGCLGLRCPELECKTNPGLELIDSLASDYDKDRYYRYLLRSYVEGSRKRKWCQGPGCDLAVQFHSKDPGNYDVVCDCSYGFCWNCLEERHHPVGCRIVNKWMKLQTSDTENNKWIRASTKQCPKCRKKIEKNEGCDHMTCPRPCGYEFCWLCLSPWKFLHFCDKYSERRDKERRLESTRENLKRYARHYERWTWNHKSRETALDTLRRAKKKCRLPFVIDALETIVESRKVLKWSFAYGYYLPITEKKKIAYLRNLQEDAEVALEKLQRFAEVEMVKYICADFRSDNKEKLVDTTDEARSYVEKLVRAVENDLSEAEKRSFSEVVVKTTSCMFMVLGTCCILRMLDVF